MIIMLIGVLAMSGLGLVVVVALALVVHLYLAFFFLFFRFVEVAVGEIEGRGGREGGRRWGGGGGRQQGQTENMADPRRRGDGEMDGAEVFGGQWGETERTGGRGGGTGRFENGGWRVNE